MGPLYGDDFKPHLEPKGVLSILKGLDSEGMNTRLSTSHVTEERGGGSTVSWDKTVSPYFLSILCRMRATQSGCLASASHPTAAIPLLSPVAGTSWSR